MSELAHTPYDGSRRPFSIGLSPLDLNDWIEIDEHLAAHLAEKERLIAEKPDTVFREEPQTRAAQAEVLALLAEFLPARFPGIYMRDGNRITIVPVGRTIDTGADNVAPLLSASRLVQEDLCLMRAGPEGYVLVAASLCFPSSWSLAGKIGRPMDRIHGPVPHWAAQLATRVNRIFDNLKVEQPVWRMNWSIYPDAALHHPESRERPRDWFSDDVAPQAFIRVERQTLRRLPASGDILFTIKVNVDPFAALRRHPDGARLAAGLRAQLMSLDEAQLTYKGMLRHRDRVAAALARLSGELTPATIGGA